MKPSHIASIAALLTTFGALASSADAKPARGRAKPTVETSPLVLTKDVSVKGDFGNDYKLGGRRVKEIAVNDDDRTAARSVSDSEVGKVVRDRVHELEYCWLRVPASKRTASSAMLKLMIEASGTVAGVDLEGEVPAGVAKCITAVASRWTFPSADAGCEIEHGLSMNTKTDTMR